MPRDWEKYAEGGDRWEAYAVDTDPWEQYTSGSRPGETPDEPLEVSGVSASERLQIQNFAPDSESARQWLQQRGYESEVGAGGRVAVRKPGDKRWKVVDPKGFELSDVLDIGDELLSGAATAGGVILGAPGGFAGGAGGGAVGSAAAEMARRGVGGALGFEQDLPEAAAAVAEEAAWGAGTELGLRFVGAGLRGAKRGVSGLVGRRAPPAATGRGAAEEVVRGKTRPLLPSSTVQRRAERAPFGTKGFSQSRVERKATPGALDGAGYTRVKAGSGTRATTSETVNAGQQAAASTPKKAKAKGSAKNVSTTGENFAKPETVEQIVKEAGDTPLRITIEKADGSRRVFQQAHMAGPKFLPRSKADAALVSMPTSALRRYALQKEGIEGALEMGRDDLLQTIWKKQPGLIKGTGKKKAATSQVIWEELVEGKSGAEAIEKARSGLLSSAVKRGGKDLGQWRSFNKGRVIEIRKGDEVIKFNKDGAPFVHEGSKKATVARGARKLGELLEMPYEAERKVAQKALGRAGRAFGGAVGRMAPLAVPGYGKVALATRALSLGGKGMKKASELLSQPGSVKELMRSGSAKVRGAVQRIVENPRNQAAVRMAAFTLMHDPTFRAWVEKREVQDGTEYTRNAE